MYNFACDNMVMTIMMQNQQVVWPPTGAADTVCPASVQNPTSQGLYSWPWQMIAHAPTAYQLFELHRQHTFGFSISRPGLRIYCVISLVTVTFDLLTSK